MSAFIRKTATKLAPVVIQVIKEIALEIIRRFFVAGCEEMVRKYKKS